MSQLRQGGEVQRLGGRLALIVALGCILCSHRHAEAQVVIEPASPRWGESITISVEPDPAAKEGQRFDRSDRLYAVLSTFRQGTSSPLNRPWTPMTWDGRRFVAHLTAPAGCEAGSAMVATAEQLFSSVSRSFVCRTPEGALPPGALIEGLVWGGRNRSRWEADVADDLAGLRTTADRGWAYAVVWLYRRSSDRAAFTPAVFLREVERVDREETSRTAGLLTSLFYGYDGAGATDKAFERLKELCDRFPESEFTPRMALYFAYGTLATHPEFEPELDRLAVQTAGRAPQNKGFRDLLRHMSKVAGVLPPATLLAIATAWIRDDPDDMHPHYLRALALSNLSGSPAQHMEAETEAGAAIERTLRPHPYDFSESRWRQWAFELRSRLRAARGDLGGAVADVRMAQTVAQDKAGADDMSVEAELWQRLGYGRKAENLAVDAYRAGSLKAEALLKQIYVSRAGGEVGFSDYLIARLREGGGSPVAAVRPAPSFSATTLDGARVDASTLRDRITVLDFWFVGCVACRVERPKLNAIVDEFGDRVRFVGFALNSVDALKTYLASNPYKYEVVPLSQAIADTFSVTSYPTHMVIDRTGTIVWMSGSDDDRVERLRAMIVRVLASQPAKPQ